MSKVSTNDFKQNIVNSFKTLRTKFGLEFWQKFARALIVVVAVMPFAGISIALGRAFSPGTYISNFTVKGANGGLVMLYWLGKIFEEAGWAVIRNLHVLFAVAIGGAWAKNMAGGAFAALIGFVAFHTLTGTLTQAFHSAKWEEYVLNSNNEKEYVYRESILGIQSLKGSGIFSGIIIGFTAGTLFNRFHKLQLPKVLEFFSGARSVPFIVIGVAFGWAIIFAGIWVFIQQGINALGKELATSKIPFLYPFIYGAGERLLLPFGLHHMITIPMNYTDLGGSYVPLFKETGTVAIKGHENISNAWIKDLIIIRRANIGGIGYFVKPEDGEKVWNVLNLQANAGTKAKFLESFNFFANFIPGKFITGQRLVATGGLFGAATAMWALVPQERRKKYAPMFFSAAATSAIAGVTEPVEFMFIFISPVLLLVHSLLAGLSFGLSEIGIIRVWNWGLIAQIAGLPQMFAAGMWADVLVYLLFVFVFGGIYFVVFYFIIKKMNLITPGHKTDSIADIAAEVAKIKRTKKSTKDSKTEAQEKRAKIIIDALGGKENIKSIDNCFTRLRVGLKNEKKVDEKLLQTTGSKGILRKKGIIQVIYGPEVEALKPYVQEAYDNNDSENKK